MKKIALVMLFVFPSSALAEMTHLPKWKMCGEKACYEFDEAKKLVEADLQLDMLLKKDADWAQLTASLQEANKQLNIALTSEKTAVVTLKNNADSLTARLLDETARANKAEARPGPFPAWAIAGGVGIVVGVIAGILLGVYVSK